MGCRTTATKHTTEDGVNSVTLSRGGYSATVTVASHIMYGLKDLSQIFDAGFDAGQQDYGHGSAAKAEYDRGYKQGRSELRSEIRQAERDAEAAYERGHSAGRHKFERELRLAREANLAEFERGCRVGYEKAQRAMKKAMGL